VVRWHHERLDGSGYPDHLHADSLDRDVRIMGVADSFDAMTSERPYRHSMTVGEALIEIVKLTPHRFDPNAVQALLIQIRRDAVSGIGTMLNGKMVMAAANDKPRFLDTHTKFDLMPTDIDQMAGMLNHKLTNGRVYSA
jgi:HD-GYP domain-containing protein (c-di-GMP phosphodiesterase class II)